MPSALNHSAQTSYDRIILYLLSLLMSYFSRVLHKRTAVGQFLNQVIIEIPSFNFSSNYSRRPLFLTSYSPQLLPSIPTAVSFSQLLSTATDPGPISGTHQLTAHAALPMSFSIIPLYLLALVSLPCHISKLKSVNNSS